MLMNSQITRMNNGFPLTDTHTAVKSKKAEGVLFFKDFISNIRSSENTAAGSADDKIKPHIYKKLEKVMKAETGKALLQGKNKRVGDHVTGSKIEKTETGVSDSQKADLILDYLAQVLGVNAGELAKLLESAGIKPGELASISQSDTLETKLTQAFGLDAGMSVTLGKILKLTESQIDEAISQALQDKNAGKDPGVKLDDTKMSDTLEKILKLTDSQIDEAISQALQDKNAEKGPGIKLDDLKLETVSSKDISAAGEAAFIETTELPGLVLQLRLKLKELGEKLEQNEKALMDEIRLNINPVLKNAAALLKVPVNTVETGESSVTDTGIGDCMEDDTVSSQEVNQANSKKEKNHAADSGTILLQSAAAGSETRENVQFLGGVLNGLQSKETEAIAENAGMKTPLSGKEILNQVIEKAKVVLTADKSEMVIDLKPDSLGKLSLKVVTEHGMVMAKFIAESQQVRQVLEANMQLLKESMEKQGLNVQGFSVSVRQESHGSRNDYNSYGDGGRRIPTIQVPGSGRMYIDAAEVDRLLRINPYRQEGNTINLTA